jgi:putative phosphoribosyl transferase
MTAAPVPALPGGISSEKPTPPGMIATRLSPPSKWKGSITMVRFRDRTDAGQRLAARLARFAGRSDVLVLALPRGGVPVAFEVAKALEAPMDVFVVRKLGLPDHEELAMGAIASGGVAVVNDDVVGPSHIPLKVFQAVAARELQELNRRERAYRGDRPAPDVLNRTVILVDDGIATGSTMRVAVAALRHLKPAQIVVASPTASPFACAQLGREVDDCVCVITPDPYYAVGVWYEDFSQTTDEEVRDLLEQARAGITNGPLKRGA